MLRPRNSIDRPLLLSVVTLVFVGFLIFSSASLGLLARDGATFTSVALGQIFLGIVGGGIGLLLATRIHYRIYRRYALYIFLLSIGVTLLVFIPGIGFSYGGATRWIDLGFTTFQPAELLKLGFVLYLASFLSSLKEKLHTLSANYIVTEFPALMNASGSEVDDLEGFKISPEAFAELMVLLFHKEISSTGAQTVLKEMSDTGLHPEQIIKEKDLGQVSDASSLGGAVDKVIADNQKAVEDYKGGKEASLKFLVGMVMRETKGKANPQVLENLIKEKIK